MVTNLGGEGEEQDFVLVSSTVVQKPLKNLKADDILNTLYCGEMMVME